ncbi:Get3/AsnA [Blattamonas nauphoetae]|uniref:Get3/AsnA n=1 Tax=Blattamonas nauphoetae TaxID=2049346 RepID=A0ABQ9X8K1_9EUKA|nr:Get3/AsnA [Blattamonas nauphoetae]
MEAHYPPTLQNIVDQDSLKWIFVGGKGGVGKTTCSCSLAVLLAKHRRSVLLVSTDPAHSISDAFDQRFTEEPTQVEGIQNLFAMEIKISQNNSYDTLRPEVGSMLNRVLQSVPGIDETMTLSLLLEDISKYGHDVVIFDTAPTGHTLKMVELPTALGNIFDSSGMIGSLMKGVSAMVLRGTVGSDGEVTPGTVNDSAIDSFKEKVQRVANLMKDPETTTFICVCIAEYLSLYETERMIQQLALNEIEVRNIIVNQVVVPNPEHPCEQCQARRRMQDKYMDKINVLYGEDFHIIRLPQLQNEVRGLPSLEKFKEQFLIPDNLRLPLINVVYEEKRRARH